ncbi:LysR family transcriptional regulator [Dyella monticola]|uniref:LysR family transcriptional regulator n=1 Tax=Dyella monticola TaxID=1927958 RepID=A0A370WUI0_9GAMM|nr:LysR family transcriptional regulator [Dyella monticola]RDS79711.1 LysR family transcriptional regulator [Dyella monticola]
MRHQFDDVLLGSIELFYLAGEPGSFTAAATAAGVTPAAVSRSVARLEERMGVRLFARITRHIRLTDVGRTYFEECLHSIYARHSSNYDDAASHSGSPMTP